jgi:hypothetical protein
MYKYDDKQLGKIGRLDIHYNSRFQLLRRNEAERPNDGLPTKHSMYVHGLAMVLSILIESSRRKSFAVCNEYERSHLEC